jgi:hypothetical protein
VSISVINDAIDADVSAAAADGTMRLTIIRPDHSGEIQQIAVRLSARLTLRLIERLHAYEPELRQKAAAVVVAFPRQALP